METKRKYLVCDLGNFYFINDKKVMQIDPEKAEVTNYGKATFDIVQKDTSFTMINKRRFLEELLNAQTKQINDVAIEPQDLYGSSLYLFRRKPKNRILFTMGWKPPIWH